MNRIDNTLRQLKISGKKMLSPYITAGDPEPNATVVLMHELVKVGADILELGVPFSDPMAEGPVIQAAMERALVYQIGLDEIFSMVEQFRQSDLNTPVVLMSYVNPVEQYGYEKFAKRAKQAGVDGTILVDLPPEESEVVAPLWEENGLYGIYLCSPTTSDNRMALLNRQAKGYLYYVSLKGVTGADFDLNELRTQYQNRKKQTQLPLMIGFGIKTPSIAANVAQFADGIIVGAALIEQIFNQYSRDKANFLSGVSIIGEMRREIDSEKLI